MPGGEPNALRAWCLPANTRPTRERYAPSKLSTRRLSRVGPGTPFQAGCGTELVEGRAARERFVEVRGRAGGGAGRGPRRLYVAITPGVVVGRVFGVLLSRWRG